MTDLPAGTVPVNQVPNADVIPPSVAEAEAAAAKVLEEQGLATAAAKEAEAKAEADKAAKAKEEEPDKAAADAAAAKLASEAAAKAAEDQLVLDTSDMITDDGWPQSDNLTLNSTVTLMKEAGVTPAEASGLLEGYLLTGDKSKIDMVALKAKLGDKTDLVLAGAEKVFGDVSQKNLAITQAGFDTVGGKENFDTVIKYCRAKAAADPEFAASYDDYKDRVNDNPTMAKMVMSELLDVFNSDKNNTTLDVSKSDVLRGTGAAPIEVHKPLSRADYYAGMKQANRDNDTALMTELRARRAKSR